MTPEPALSPILEAQGVSKRYAGVQALDDVSVAIRRGEVLAVVGENGAGKSTLMKILAGVTTPSSGSLYCDGQQVAFANVQQALAAGVALIHQELNLATNLDVGANVYLGREPRRFGFISGRAIAERTSRQLSRLGLDVSPSTRVDSLTIGQQQLVEIAKAISTDARVLIMDEPTSSLSIQDADRLRGVIRQLAESGVSIVYISHRLNEIVEMADRAVVLRDGRQVGELVRGEISRDRMVRMMVGRDVAEFYHRTPHATGAAVLSAKALRTTLFPDRQVDFEIRSGEIVGLAGLVGAGRTELLTTLFGVDPAVGGRMELGGEPFQPRGPAEAIAGGVVLAPEDRRLSGLLLEMGVRENLSLASLRSRLNRLGLVRLRDEGALCQDAIRKLRIKTAHPETRVRLLSGGNQQKVVLGKWLATQPRVLLLDEPTRGIDVGAKAEIYELMHELAGQGVAILFASSDMEEIRGLSDRVLVMHMGGITGELRREEMTEEAIMRLAVGDGPVTRQAAAT